MGGEEYRVSLHADDVLVTIIDLDSGLPVIMKILEMYGRYSGYILNMHKTQALTFNCTPPKHLLRNTILIGTPPTSSIWVYILPKDQSVI